jgi:hypothetical protein
MAYIGQFTCTKCEKPKHEVVSRSQPNVCAECRGKEASRAKRVHLAGLTGLTPEERLAKIEEQLYDLDLKRRLEALESHHIRY